MVREGYLRPHWVTLESGGVNGNSALPRAPEAILRAAEDCPPQPRPAAVPGGLARRVAWDLGYRLATLLTPWLHPGYETHRPHHPLAEFAGWSLRLARHLAWERRRDLRALDAFLARPAPFHLFALQLDSDFQIRRHSPFASMADALDQVLASFAAAAPPDHRLLVKQHPLHNGLADLRGTTRRLARRHGLAGRVLFVDTGHLPTILRDAAGVVTVNSTVGGSALGHGCPTIVLGKAVYDIPGLTFQGGLDAFWTGATPPDMALLQAFRRLVIASCQVNGGFYSPRGMRLAVAGTLPRLLAPPADALRRAAE